MCFCFPPTLTMMHLCITKCTYWTPLTADDYSIRLVLELAYILAYERLYFVSFNCCIYPFNNRKRRQHFSKFDRLNRPKFYEIRGEFWQSRGKIKISRNRRGN